MPCLNGHYLKKATPFATGIDNNSFLGENRYCRAEDDGFEERY